MKKGLKIGLILGGTGIAIASTIFIIKKVKGGSTGSGSSSGGGSSVWSGKITDLGIPKSGGLTSIGIKGDDRPPEFTFGVGNTFTLKGTNYDGTYPVEGTWIDSNGNIGAIYSNQVIPTGATKDTGGSRLYEMVNATATVQ